MSIPDQFRREADRLPPALRALLDAELAAGNAITEVSHTFPAPPAGAYFMLANAVSTRARASDDEIQCYARNTSLYSGEFHDARRFYFIREPPLPPPPEPDMDALRAAINARQQVPPAPAERIDREFTRIDDASPRLSPGEGASDASSPPGSPLQRFLSSMEIDYEKWREGIGYDLDALRAASAGERARIERVLVTRSPRGWRDVEALVLIDSETARDVLRTALQDGNAEVRVAVMKAAPELVSNETRTRMIVDGIESAELMGGLGEIIDEAADFHPPPVVDALFRGALHREGDVAVHCAALLYFIHGLARHPFDWDHRPFFLRFNTGDRPTREAAFRELCEAVQVDPARFV